MKEWVHRCEFSVEGDEGDLSLFTMYNGAQNPSITSLSS